MINISIFASGNGSNAENIIKYFANNELIKIKQIITNNPDAYVIQRAKKFNIPSIIISKKELNNEDFICEKLIKDNINYIVLAGFLLLIPSFLVKQYNKKIINIHPALLPKYGGKGMYGDYVHKSVIDNNEKESGITIHFVNEYYDEGNIIFQAKCKVDKTDDYKSLAIKIHKLEYEFYPKIIETIIKKIYNE